MVFVFLQNLFVVLFPLVVIPIIIYYLKNKKNGDVDKITSVVALFILSVMFLGGVFRLPNYLKARAKYEDVVNIENEEIKGVIFINEIRTQGSSYPLIYYLTKTSDIIEFNHNIKKISFALAEGNLKGIEYWEIKIIKKSDEIITYKISDTPKDLYIELIVDGVLIAEGKNNNLRPLLNFLSKKRPLTRISVCNI